MEEKRKGSLSAPPWLRLSGRLLLVADFVPAGGSLADIGTDHGYVPIYLACTGKIDCALAVDVGKGPLERAKSHVRDYEEWIKARGQMAVPIKTRLSDGLSALAPGEADTVVMAGMGGELVIRILEAGRFMWESVKTWVLSPQSDLDKVRRYLWSEGFCIEDESMIKDEGKFYTVMRVIRGTQEPWRDVHFRYGKRLMEKRDPVLGDYLVREKKRVEGILENLREDARRRGEATPGQESAEASLKEELAQIEEALYEMQ